MGLERQGWIQSESDTAMRDVVFQVLSERQGHLEARAMELPLGIAAASLQNLSRLEQHRRINQAVAAEFASGLHALRITVLRDEKPSTTINP